MKTLLFFFAAILSFNHIANAQTIFTYGSHEVSEKEFLDAYNKNPDTTGNKAEKLQQYLDLYINFRLKLQAAYDEKANQNAELKSEGENFKNQLAENYINQQANITQLLHEAFQRSQKDILVKQVFVKFSGKDTAAAFAQITKAYEALKSGKNFEDVATLYSNDPSVQASKGDMGYITVFTLPYPVETLIYNLTPGKYSTIYKSKIGYFIFKNVSERNALGRRKIEQLLFNTPDFLNAAQIDSVKQLADSVYNLLQSGTPFNNLSAIYGHYNYDLQSADAIEVGVGDYSNDFENAVFTIKLPGNISKPFQTAYGFNIIKLDAITPVGKDENDVNFMGYLQSQIQNDGRLEIAKANLVDGWLKLTGYKENNYNHEDLWTYTDSALEAGDVLPASLKSIKPESVLFHFTKKDITAKDWIEYLRSGNINPDTKTGYSEKMHDFVRAACNDYYRANIEDFDAAASGQIKEFNEANMLFYVMDKHVWSKAANDSAGLRKYFEEHKNKYTWNKSLTALVISAPDKIVADSIAAKIKNNPSDWRKIVAPYNNSVYADSSRFEYGQLPIKQPVQFEKDYQSLPESNESGDSYVFIHVLNIYPQQEPRSFDDAKGIVINDFQQKLEIDWLESLKKQYPVKVNKTILAKLR
ncbi:MAG: peptidylprolyl isomerase [Bacteroidetes bacterium]|nr:peptidylprolyl isomerase [Bacteroidota bacterium]